MVVFRKLSSPQEKEITAYINDLFDGFITERIGRKFLTIAKTNQKWINLLDNTELKLEDVHDAFQQLEFFFNSDMTGYYIYFNAHPNDWTIKAVVEYLMIERAISADSE